MIHMSDRFRRRGVLFDWIEEVFWSFVKGTGPGREHPR